MKNKQTYEIVLTGLGMALVFVATMFIKVPNALDGYFIAKYMLKGSWIVAASEIPANVVQGVAGIVIALVAYPMVKKIVQDKLN